MEPKKQSILRRLRKEYRERVAYFGTTKIKEQIELYRVTTCGKDAHEEYGKNLRSARKRLGLTLDEVGKIIGLTGEAVRKYELAKNQTSNDKPIDLVYLEMFALIYDVSPVELLPGPLQEPFVFYHDVLARVVLIEQEIGRARYGYPLSGRLRHTFLKIIKAKQDEEHKYYNFYATFIRTPLFRKIMDVVGSELAKEYVGDGVTKSEDVMTCILTEFKNKAERCTESLRKVGVPPHEWETIKNEEELLEALAAVEIKKGTAGRFEKTYHILHTFGKEEGRMLSIMAHIVVSNKELWTAFCNFVEGGKYFCGEKYDFYKP